jgi:hypothetical protein
MAPVRKNGAHIFVLLVTVAIVPVRAQQKPQTHKVYMSVVDASDRPVLDLTASDFQIKENGAPRPVVGATVAQLGRIILMVDNSDAAAGALTPIRAGVQQFIDAIPPLDEIALLTTGRQLRIRVPPTTDRKKLKDAVGLIYPDSGSPSVLMSGLLETFNRFYKATPDRWATFVIVTTDGPENSNMNPKQFAQFEDTLAAREVVVHAVTLSTRGLGMQSDAALTLAQNSHGHVDVLKVPTALPDKMKALGAIVAQDSELLARQYVVEYSAETPIAPQSTIEVVLARPGARPVLSPGRPTR